MSPWTGRGLRHTISQCDFKPLALHATDRLNTLSHARPRVAGWWGLICSYSKTIPRLSQDYRYDYTGTKPGLSQGCLKTTVTTIRGLSQDYPKAVSRLPLRLYGD
ncbi:hypothetical protein RRG08_044300 [Elysia crispata]|uniref:Uncharacterized protein n=1 Tax=Elysia crispata TaxID=231223 RepID=A0AAE0XYT1_9GAST|nr:hypothetical protein RRG08_044300 [Elysia crispata]